VRAIRSVKDSKKVECISKSGRARHNITLHPIVKQINMTSSDAVSDAAMAEFLARSDVNAQG
jgi:hypothetical protein